MYLFAVHIRLVHTSTLFGFAAVLPHLGYERRLPWFSLKYLITDATNFVRARGLPGRLRGDGDGVAWLQVHGAASHKRWGVVETPISVKTQGRNMDRSLTFNVYALCRVSFLPSGEDRGSEGRRPKEPDCQRRQTLLRAGALGARDRMQRRLPEYRQWPTGQSCTLAHGARSASGPLQEPAKAHGADGASTPRRATIPELAGDVPRTGRRTLRFNTNGELALLWSFTHVPAVGDLLVCVFALSFVFPYSLKRWAFLRSLVFPGSCLRTLVCFRCHDTGSVALPNSRFLHPWVPLPCVHGNVAVCGATFWEMKVWLRTLVI